MSRSRTIPPKVDGVNQTILLASRNDGSLRIRSATLKRAGFRTVCTNNLSRTVWLSFDIRPNLIVVGDSFTDEEQAAFVDVLHECQPGICVLCLKSGMEGAHLVDQCRAILSEEPGCTRVRLSQAS